MPIRTMRCGESPARSCSTPLMRATIRPEAAGTIPRIAFIRVLLPFPLVPRSATVSPSATRRDRPWSTCTPPYPARSPSIRKLPPKVRPLHLGIVEHHLGRAVRDLVTGHQHRAPLREAEDGGHDVLNQDDRDAAGLHLEKDGENLVRL